MTIYKTLQSNAAYAPPSPVLRDKLLQVGVDPDILHANGSKLIYQLCTYTNKFFCIEEKGKTEDEMVGWHHRLNGHEFE